MVASARCNPVTNRFVTGFVTGFVTPPPSRPVPTRPEVLTSLPQLTYPNTHEERCRGRFAPLPPITPAELSAPTEPTRVCFVTTDRARGRRTIGPMTKPRPVSHQFGPFMVANRKLGKMVPPYFSTGFKQHPVASAELTVELDDKTQRMTATRIIAGGVLAGPAGAIIGAMARKDVTKGRIILHVDGQHVQTHEFPAKDLAKASAFVEAVTTAQQQATT